MTKPFRQSCATRMWRSLRLSTSNGKRRWIGGHAAARKRCFVLILFSTARAEAHQLTRQIQSKRLMKLHSLALGGTDIEHKCLEADRRVEAPGRVELPTNGLGNRCSIHLSYGANAT